MSDTALHLVEKVFPEDPFGNGVLATVEVAHASGLRQETLRGRAGGVRRRGPLARARAPDEELGAYADA